MFRLAEEWSDEGPPADSRVVLVRGGDSSGKFGFGVVDADCDFARRIAPDARMLSRADVVDTDLAREIFAVIDMIWLNDERIKEITERASQPAV